MRIINDEILNHIFDYDVILVGMGINNSFQDGFAYDIRLNFPEVREYESKYSPYGDRRKYGTIMPIEKYGKIFCMCYIHNGGYTKRRNNVFVNYDFLDKCLKEVSLKYGNKKIATTMIGSTPFDGNGDKDKIIDIIKKHFSDKDIDVYDFEQKSFQLEIYHELSAMYKDFKDKKISNTDMEKLRSQIYWKKNNGIFKEMPSDYVYKKKNKSKGRLTVKKKDLKNK